MKVLAFGIAKEIFCSSAVEVELTSDPTINELRALLEKRFPQLTRLGSYMIAVNNEYASVSDRVKEGDEIAVIPPVSGG